MKTLGTLAIIWILYSMYRVFIKDDVQKEFLFGPNDIIFISAFVGALGLFVGSIYLIITYLP